VREEIEGLEPVEERDREAKIAVEEVPSIDAMGNCLWVQPVLQPTVCEFLFLYLHSLTWFLIIGLLGCG
jgi:hypothetical protein